MDRKVPCEVYSRIVGYHRPIGFWNKGKKEEYKQRVVYKAPQMFQTCCN